jgi:PAS domain S-box-containing protein
MPWFCAEDVSGFSSLLQACEAHFERLASDALARLGEHPKLGSALRESRPAALQVAHDVHDRIRQAALGNGEPLEATLVELGKRLSRAGVSVSDYWQAADIPRNLGVSLLIRAYSAEPVRAHDAIRALSRVLERVSTALAREELDCKERQLSEQRQRTEQAVLRFSRLSESGVLGILVCDLVGNILEANDGFLGMVGYSRAELLSGEVRWADMTPPEWKHLDDDAVQQLIARGVTRPWEKEYFRKDGTRLPILVGVAMLNDTECVAFALDISERKRLEELRSRSAELEAQNRRIQEASRLKSEFLANMSHELRTPLNSIIGFAQLLRDGEVDRDSPQHNEFLGDILTSGRHLLQLINDVLDLAKVESGKMDFRPETVDLRHLVSEVGAVLRSIAASKRIQLDTDVASDLASVSLDPARLKQVLYNYLSNAIKFTPEGGRVSLRVSSEGAEAIRIEVEDTGVGIAPSDFERLFVEFQQLDAAATKKQGGTGLGLALTKRIVEAQGGSVGVKSVRGEGSVFFAVLPKSVPVEIEHHELVPALARHEGASVVLVVEDDPRDRSLLVNTLSRAGYDVQVAVTGQEASVACREQAFDAITLDLLLPDTTGLDILHRIRVEGKNRETPVVVVTVIAERGVVGGFSVQDYLQKPVNGPDLLTSLLHAGVPPDKAGTLLVVDDDPSALKLMKATLGKLGYAAQYVSDAESALAMCEARRPAAVILDLLMPQMDGFEFLVRFRSVPNNRAIPVVVWTMKDLTHEDRDRLHRLAQGVVGKTTGNSVVEQLRALLPPPAT